MNDMPEEMAKYLKVVSFMLPEEHESIEKMTFEQAGKLANLIALKIVDRFIEERKRRPKSYWVKVKKHLQKPIQNER